MNLDQLSKIDLSTTDHVLGLFNEYHVEYDDMRVETRDPSITDMTEAAIQVLLKMIFILRCICT